MAEHGRRSKFCHINTPLPLMLSPWGASLHKLSMAVGKISATPFCDGHYLTILNFSKYVSFFYPYINPLNCLKTITPYISIRKVAANVKKRSRRLSAFSIKLRRVSAIYSIIN